MSTDVLSIRIRKELKERMKRARIDWGREIESFIEMRLKGLSKEESLKRAREIRGKLEEVPEQWRLIREARDAG